MSMESIEVVLYGLPLSTISNVVRSFVSQLKGMSEFSQNG